MKLSIVSTVLPFMADSGENLRSTNNTQSVFPSKIYFSHVLKFILATVLSIFTFMFSTYTIRFNLSFYRYNISKFVNMPLFCICGAKTISFFIEVGNNITNKDI